MKTAYRPRPKLMGGRDARSALEQKKVTVPASKPQAGMSSRVVPRQLTARARAAKKMERS